MSELSVLPRLRVNSLDTVARIRQTASDEFSECAHTVGDVAYAENFWLDQSFWSGRWDSNPRNARLEAWCLSAWRRPLKNGPGSGS